jgi:hypothetical protein
MPAYGLIAGVQIHALQKENASTPSSASLYKPPKKQMRTTLPEESEDTQNLTNAEL